MKSQLLLAVLFVWPVAAQDNGDTALQRGAGELAISGGVAMHWSPWSSSNAVRFGYAAGLTRNLALIGAYSLHHYASDSGCIFGLGCATGKLRGHEYTVGGRVSLPLRGVTPYALGALGGLRQAHRVESGLTSLNTGRTYFVVGGGGGLDIRVNPYFGFQLEVRGMTSPGDGPWYMQPMVGVYIRHR